MELLIYGEEPYRCQEVFQSFFGQVFEACFTESLFSFGRKRRILVRLEELKKDEALEAYLKAPCPTCDLIVYASKVSSNTKVFKAFQKQEYRRLNAREFSEFVKRKARELGGELEDDAIEELYIRTGYRTSEDISLYEVVGELKNLIGYQPHVDREQVIRQVQSAAGSAFELAALFCAGRYPELIQLSNSLSLEKDFNGIGTLSLFLSNFKRGYEKKVLKRPARCVSLPDTITEAELVMIMEIVTRSIREIKASKYSDRVGFRIAMLRLVGQQLM